MNAINKQSAPSPHDLWEMDRHHSLHPWAQFGTFEREGSLIITRGEGCNLWDANGKQYFDAVGGVWCNTVGLANREMAQAIFDQVMQLGYSNYFVDMGNDAAALLGARLASLAPGDLNRVHFTTGGSTAVDTAIRMINFYQYARGFPEKTGIVARENSYHGSTYLCQSVGKRQGDRVEEFRYLSDGIYHLSCPDPYRRPPGMSESEFTDALVDEFETLVAKVGAERIGGFIAEPIQASGGLIIPPKAYLRRMWEICQRHDILFIADEVVTGFGRLGQWFASETEFNVIPDIITCAKGLSSGYVPLGAVVFSDRIWSVIATGGQRWFTTGFTYSGHPVACRAALTNIEIMERTHLLAHVQRVGTYFEERLAELADLPLVGDVRGRKLMLCTENVANKATKEPMPHEAGESKRISNACEEMGLLVRPIGHLNVMSPSLTIQEFEVDFVVETLGAAIRKVTDDLVREGYRIG